MTIDDAGHLLAPGIVQSFNVQVGNTTTTYLAIANRLSNNVLIYQQQSNGSFTAAHHISGRRPSCFDHCPGRHRGRRPDLLVANFGSNDVSVLIGTATANGWTATAYQRPVSGGSGPIAVAVRDTGGGNGPDLLVTNNDGTVALLPGIGSFGQGSGFFQAPQSLIDLPGPIVDSVNGQFFLGVDGSVSSRTDLGFTTIISAGVTALAAFDSYLVAGFADGDVGLFEIDGTLLDRQDTGFTDKPSALEVLARGNQADVFLTYRGIDIPVIVSLHIAAPPPASTRGRGNIAPVRRARLFSGRGFAPWPAGGRLGGRRQRGQPGPRRFCVVPAAVPGRQQRLTRNRFRTTSG